MDILGSILGALGGGNQTVPNQNQYQLPSGSQSGLTAEGEPAGLWDKIQQGLSGKGNQMTMLADTIGQRLNPTTSNVMGGLGTAFAKSDMAGKKLEADKAEYKDLLASVLEDLKSDSDMNKIGLVKDPATGNIKLDQQTNIPRKIDETLQKKESSADASSAKSNQTPGTMQDMMNMFQ